MGKKYLTTKVCNYFFNKNRKLNIYLLFYLKFLKIFLY